MVALFTNNSKKRIHRLFVFKMFIFVDNFLICDALNGSILKLYNKKSSELS